MFVTRNDSLGIAKEVSSLYQEIFPSPREHHFTWKCFLLLEKIKSGPEWLLDPPRGVPEKKDRFAARSDSPEKKQEKSEIII